MTISDLDDQLSSLVRAVSGGEIRVVVEQAGVPVAALISADDLDRLHYLDRAWQAGTRALERFGEASIDVPLEELETKLD